MINTGIFVSMMICCHNFEHSRTIHSFLSCVPNVSSVSSHFNPFQHCWICPVHITRTDIPSRNWDVGEKVLFHFNVTEILNRIRFRYVRLQLNPMFNKQYHGLMLPCFCLIVCQNIYLANPILSFNQAAVTLCYFIAAVEPGL